jgi:tetratricopeptide (TPR) repeat protein
MTLSQFWMAPEKGSVRTAAQANLATAVKFENDGEHTRALTLLNNPATRQDGVLATYADYYRALALLHLNRTAEARTTFRALQSGTLVGYLAEMAALREAECDVELGDNDAALTVYERLAATRTLAPDDVLMKLGKAAQAAGANDKAQAAFEKVYYDYPLSDLIDEAAAELDDVPVSGGTLKFQQEPRTALLAAANAGGDSAARCAMIGSWLGALHGVQALPKQWRDRVAAKAEIERCIARILERRA